MTKSSGTPIRFNAAEEAKAFFYEGMKLLDSMPDTELNRERRISLLVNQWAVFMLLLKGPEYYELLTRYKSVTAEVQNSGLVGAFYVREGHCEWQSAHFDKAVPILTRGLELCEAAGNEQDAGLAYLTLQWSYLYWGDWEPLFALKEDILRTMERRFDLRIYGLAFSGFSWAYSYLGFWDQAIEEGQNALDKAQYYSDNSMISVAAWITSLAYTCKGDIPRALEYVELGVEKAPTFADKAWAQGALGLAWCRAGEPRRGVELLEAVVPLNRAGRFRPAEIPQTAWLGEGYWLAGEYDKGTRELEYLLEIAESSRIRFYVGSAHRLLGEIALATTDLKKAEPHFEKSVATLQEINAQNELALAYAGYGRYHKQQGNLVEARGYLTKALKIFERLGTLIEPDKVRQELAEL